MDLLQLRYFQVVARLEHMTRAAEELHISQPSLSKMISRLEKHLGVPLFDRHGKQIRLNRFGQAFLKRVERVFSELEEGQHELADLTGLERGQVFLAAATGRLLPELLSSFLRRHPHVNVKLLQGTTQECQNLLERGEVDLAITHPLIEEVRVQSVPLLTENMFLAVPPNHRLASQKQVSLQEAAEETFISLTKTYELTETTTNMCRQAGFTPNIAFECNDAEVILRMVHNGLGVALVPEHWWTYPDHWHTHASEKRDTPVYLPIVDHYSKRVVGLSWIKGRYLTMAARELRDFTIRYFEEQNRDVM
ncbi:LysR substrate-binding domain-containing protein [Brevibacillus brevis]|uniref:LysR substrate-binding domain-containing protein n=1 Tax=Brevibacillus brevis TaxID=1393 RepID=A0ABY9T5P8_BREBE|nr:LysR substrate-binding domain-containing protein [Brevibacillus brevis]WNC15182.1 LysR substrate-binding domain-containing protein [Brevibacillus brevis]